MPYSTITSPPTAWEQLSSVSSAGGGIIGFELKVNDQFPMPVLDVQPVYLLS